LSEGPEPLLDALLAALREGLQPGADALWSALTPRARAPLGDPAGTRRALANELLSPLVGHTRSEVAEWERADGVARTRVSVSGTAQGPADGAATATAKGAATFLVSARRDADGAWRISGLRRDDLPWS
jgi:hypothetical protein